MANSGPQTSVAQLFTELSKFAKDGEFSKAQKTANKILKEIPNDKDAIHCKAICLIQQSLFKEALDVVLSIERKGILNLPFEKAYCLYRLNNLAEASKILKDIPEPGLREKELLAQVFYRLEDYKACLGLYRDLIKNSQDDFGGEREANMLAVIAAAKLWNNLDLGDASLRHDTFELCYNYGCLLLARGDLNGAQLQLQEAEVLCRKSLEDEPDITEQEIQEEVGIIRTQLAYIQQLKGRTEDAIQTYSQVLRNKPNDAALAAVVSNNIVTINKDKDVFDSKKKLKAMSADGLEYKLTNAQHQSVEVNKGLLNMYTNQIEACKKNIAKLKTKHHANEKAALVQAAMHLRDKHPDQAIKSLKELIGDSNVSSDLQLALAQLYLTRGKVKEATDIMLQVKILQHTPAMVSFLVSLFTQLDDTDSAIKILDDAVHYMEENKDNTKKENLISLIKENAAFKLRHGKTRDSVDMLEKLRREDPSDTKTLAKIITAYSQINPKKAEEYSEELPDFAEEGVDAEALERQHLTGSVRFSKKFQKPDTAESQSEEIITKKKKKKRKKGKLPKNYNPEIDPDPERWLPRWERSTFKHKKQKRGQLGKGASQGSVAMETHASPSVPKVASASATASPTPSSPSPSPNVVPPRQQNPKGAKSKPKKKKKGGW